MSFWDEFLEEKEDSQTKPISEPQKTLSVKDIKEVKNEPTKLKKDTINVPIRVMMSIVTQLKMFDINSKGLTPKGRNKKELKIEIKHLVSKLSEK